MDESPSKKPTSSKVIDSLHGEIDQLKEELENVKTSNNNYKKKYELANKKNELYIDQLANAKHENDMINALLKRKERRILDLETEHGDLISNNDQLKMNNKNMKIRCDNLQELSASSTAEFERLKIAYDALTASQLEYKRHYESEVLKLNENFKKFKLEYLNKYEQLVANFNNNDKDVDTLLDGLTNKRKTLDNLYFNKNKSILELLTKLASLSKIHGQDTKQILQDNLDNLLLLREKYPDLVLKINEYNQKQQDQPKDQNGSIPVAKPEINLDEILADSTEAINSNSSFDEEATLIEEPKLSRQNTLKSKNKKKKHQFPNNNHSNNHDNKFEKARTPTPPSNNINENKPKFRNNNNNNNNSSKRRSMYGNNNYSHSHSHSQSHSNSHPQPGHSRNNSSHTNFKRDIPINT